MSQIEDNLNLMNHFVNVANKHKTKIAICIMLNEKNEISLEDSLQLGPKDLGELFLNIGFSLLGENY